MMISFRLGGDSSNAVRLISLLEKDGISCSVGYYASTWWGNFIRIKDVKEIYLNDINDVAFEDKIIEVFISNLRWRLPKPKINSHLIYLSTTNKFKEELDEMDSDNEFINIYSTHFDIIAKDVDKILKYLN